MQSSKFDYYSQDPHFPSLLIIGTLFLGAFFGYLNETLLNVALTTIMHEFSVDKATVQWMTTGFLLIMGALTPITASIIQWFHTRTMALITLGTFLTGSLICAFAPNFYVLLAGRLIQATAAAIQMPLLMNAILAVYPPEKRGRAMSLVAMTFTAAPAIGPTLSGFIVDHFGWRYLFGFTALFTFSAMLVVLKALKVNLIETTKPRIDSLSAVLAVVGFGGLVYASSQFSHLSLSFFIGLFVVSIGLIAWFSHRQFQLAEPLLDLRAFAHPQFRYTVILVAIGFFLFLGLELLLPMFTQQVLLLSGTITGLILLPASITEAIFAPIFGYLLDKKGARVILLPCAIIMVGGLVAIWQLLALDINIVLLSTFFALFAVSISGAITGETHGLNHLPKTLEPHGTAIFSTIGPIAGALGAAFFVGITGIGEQLSRQSDAGLKMLDGMHLAFGCGLCLAVVALFFAFKIKGKAND